MSDAPALPFVLDILDDGLRLYRAHLRHFVLVMLLPLVALAMAQRTIQALVVTYLGDSWGWYLVGWLVGALIGYPLLLIALAAVGRSTAALLDGRRPSLRAALAWSPSRGCGMLLFNGCFGLLASIGAMSIALSVSCPLIYLLGAAAGFVSALMPAADAFALPGVLVASQLVTIWNLVVGGALLASLVYAVQPFALEQLPFGATARRALRLPLNRLSRSLGTLAGAGAILSATQGVWLTSGLSLLGMGWTTLIEEGTPVPAALLVLLITGWLALALPPLAIWTALLYRRLAAEEAGLDLAARIEAWQSL
ncbi:hypothetical protein [Kallotenue papyrolyticum]|uniref:hypothetical protein n=1 Tax=Kallotenue papyrolyticum TaxID=1325125 RepID=UPI00047859F0|nr:hypothetical protein [Kallotenue papyrolyticum]